MNELVLQKLGGTTLTTKTSTMRDPFSFERIGLRKKEVIPHCMSKIYIYAFSSQEEESSRSEWMWVKDKGGEVPQ